MVSLFYCITIALFFWLGGFTIYMLCNHGLAPNARLQQFLRYLAAAIVAVIPLGITGITDSDFLQPVNILVLLTSLSWMLTYPLAYHLTHRSNSPDYDNQIDIAFGIYLFGWLTGLLMIPYATLLVGLLMFVLLMIPTAQWIYYAMYHTVITENGMQLIQDTGYNEIIEFFHSYQKTHVLAVTLLVCVLAFISISVPFWNPITINDTSYWRLLIAAATTIFTTIYMWKQNHGLFVRTGIVVLYRDVRSYVAQNNNYIALQKERIAQLKAKVKHPLPSPHTILMIIGESASRDFMSAFMKDMTEDTTPWLRELSTDTDHCVLFPHAYSCDIQTVPTLEKALTEHNQYDGGNFYTSCSIVDIAKKLGYRVHWYSNQGHLGTSDTPITLVANSSHTARWTRQVLNQIHYDESLLDMMKEEVDPNCNNMVVLHLKGSHFNYENRFPSKYRVWGEEGNHDKIINYKNTLRYTDSVLQRAFDYARTTLNLQAMVYFSDHADVPDRHRQPNFGGFRDTRIPLVVWMSDNYQSIRPQRAEAIKNNSQCYWTNDLAYELICGLMDVESDHFKESNSLASPTYNMRREQLSAINGRIHIAEDNPPRISY